MKSHTDLPQSKKLAEILPLESADMCYKCIEDDPYDIICKAYSSWTEKYKCLLVSGDIDVIPCWSLAALLDHLRKIDCFPDIEVDDNEVTMSVFYYYDDEVGNIHPVHKIIVKADNFVDACYELILKMNNMN